MKVPTTTALTSGRRIVAALAAGVLALGVTAGIVQAQSAHADTVETYWDTPSSPATINDNLLKTYGVRAGSAGGDFMGVTNTNFDFTGGKASQTTQYTDYTADDLSGTAGSGLAIWATSVNENPNPYYQNLYYNTVNGTSTPQATTWMSNPEESSWGDSNGEESHVGNVESGAAVIAGLEYSPDIIFGANKSTCWNLKSDGTNSETIMYEEGVSQMQGYNPTFTTNDATNLWTQIYTMGQLATAADSLTDDTDKITRYNSSDAEQSAVYYEEATRGQLLYVASQIDKGVIDKKTVAYLYAVDADGTGYFFTPKADGLLFGDDSGTQAGGKESTEDTANSNYAANNSTINMGYMATLPFVTDTFDSGVAFRDETNKQDGIVMKVEDIFKANPACTVATGSAKDLMADVDLIIYNTSTASSLAGTSGGKNSSGVENAAPLSADTVLDWAKQYGFAGDVLAGDDFGTSGNQGIGSADTTEEGMSPLLYCQRNYTADKDTRAAWGFSKVYPELYNTSDDTYAFWVNKVYHVKTENVGTVVKYMTNQSDEVIYDEYTAQSVIDKAEEGLAWWLTTGSASDVWSKYAYYNGSSRASYYFGASAADGSSNEETKDTIGIFAPSALWFAYCEADRSIGNQLAGSDRFQTMWAIVSATFTSSEYAVLTTGDNFPDALAASTLAGALRAPIVTVGSADTQSAVETLVSLGVSKLYVVGGTAAVSEEQLSAVSSGANIQAGNIIRIDGEVRQETAINVAKTVAGLGQNPTTAIIATGKTFADALSISPYAYAAVTPIYLTEDDGTLSDATKAAVLAGGYSDYIFVGGEKVVSEEVKTQLGTSSVNRLGGDNRYDTSAYIAQFVISSGLAEYVDIVAPTGDDFADALVGAPYAGETGSLMVLVDETDAPSVMNLLSANKYYVKSVTYLGGMFAVSSDARALVASSVAW